MHFMLGPTGPYTTLPKGQRLMVISHPAPASRAMTLSCRLNLALLTTKLPLSPPSHNVLSTVSPHLHLGGPGLTRRKNAEELAGASGSQLHQAQDQKLNLW